MKSPVPYITDEAFEKLPVPERALHVARSYLGQREIPENRGPFVFRLLAAVGIHVPAPWCGAFVSVVLMEAGVPREKLPKNPARVRSWRNWAKALGRIVHRPRRGDLFLWVNANGTGHIGFVVEVRGTEIRTFEGNTNDAASREGDRVAEQWRPIQGLTFIELRGLA
jgi:hypothetical protein